MPGFLYQTNEEGKRTRQWRDRKSVLETEHYSWREEVVSAIKQTIRENMWCKCEIN